MLELLKLAVVHHKVEQNLVIREVLEDVRLKLAHVFLVPLRDSIDVELYQFLVYALDVFNGGSLNGRVL